ncbi:MAG TPA: AAA family ATPase [Thermaerobacter sp.]
MQDYATLIRHEGNRHLFEAVEMSIIAQLWGEPLHLHAEGVRGTGKTTILRAARRILPRIERIRGCPYNCDPQAPHCPLHAHWTPDQIAAHGTEWIPMPFREISPSAKVGTVTGSLDLARLTDATRPEAALLPGTLAQAHRGIVLVDEINRLADVAPELADCLLDVMGTKPGRLQIEETGLPPVEIPVRVAVWAASNPDEEPGPLEEIRRQLSDRFDLVLDVRRPGEPWLVKRILMLGEARARAAAQGSRAAAAATRAGAGGGAPSLASQLGDGAAKAAAGAPGGAAQKAATGRDEPAPGPAGTGADARPGAAPPAGQAAPAAGDPHATAADGVSGATAAGGRTNGWSPAGTRGEGPDALAGDGHDASRAAAGAAVTAGSAGAAVSVGSTGAVVSGGSRTAAGTPPVTTGGPAPSAPTPPADDEWSRRWRDAAARRPEFPEALLDLLAEIYVQFRLESLRALEAWRHGAALYAARSGRRQVLRADILEIAPAVLRHRVEAGVLSEILEFLAREGEAKDGSDAAPGTWNSRDPGNRAALAGDPYGGRAWQAVPGGGVARAEAGDVPGAPPAGDEQDGEGAARPVGAGWSGGDTGPGGVWSRLRGMLARAAGHGAGGLNPAATPPAAASRAAAGGAAGAPGGGFSSAAYGGPQPGPGRGAAGSAGTDGPYGSFGTGSPFGSLGLAAGGTGGPAQAGSGAAGSPLRPGAREGTTPPHRARPLLELTRDRAIRSWGRP